jgi:hypothetical protein
MNEILQALAKMLNMTVDEVSSLLDTFKGNAPQIYEMLLKEKVLYESFRFLSVIFLFITIVALIATVCTTIYYFVYQGEKMGYWNLKKDEVLELFEKQVESHRKKLKPFLIGSYTALTLGGTGFVVVTVLKTVLAPNYIFLVKEILPKLTH